MSPIFMVIFIVFVSQHEEKNIMGFGIALFGYAFLLLHEMGGAVFAAPLLAYGFFLASRLENNFVRASISSLFLLPRGIVQLLTVVGVIDIDTLPVLNIVTFIHYLLAWMMVTYFWYIGVINIAVKCNAQKLERQARGRMIITIIFILFSFAVLMLNTAGILGDLGFTISSLQYVLQYVVIFINILFMHTCFVLITSEKQYEKDKQLLAKEQAAALEKMHKDKQEAARKLEKRNNRKK